MISVTFSERSKMPGTPILFHAMGGHGAKPDFQAILWNKTGVPGECGRARKAALLQRAVVGFLQLVFGGQRRRSCHGVARRACRGIRGPAKKAGSKSVPGRNFKGSSLFVAQNARFGKWSKGSLVPLGGFLEIAWQVLRWMNSHYNK